MSARSKSTPVGSTISYSIGSHVKSYTVQQRLGSGGFADVYLTKSNETSQLYACKFIEKASIKSAKHFSKVKSEIQLHALCGGDSAANEYVVPFKRYFETEATLYIMIGYCPNGCLQSLLKRRRRLSECETRFLMQQVSAGVHYLHSQFSIIHRDLKLANILLDERMRVKICDFGLAARLETAEQRKTTICGTPNYIAPEIASGINGGGGKGGQYGGHSYEVDIWSLGVMAFTMIFGAPPFQTSSIKHTLSKIKRSDFEFPATALISENAKLLIRGALHVDPKQRLDLAQLMRHAFFTRMPVPQRLPVVVLQRAPTKQELFPEGLAAVCDKENSDATMADPSCNANAPQSVFSVQSGGLQAKMHGVSVHGVKFVDYSNRYGVGYILSNGCTGCYFNDATSLLLPIHKRFLCYVDAKGARTAFDYRRFESENSDAALSKKFAILMQMAKMLWKDFTVNGDATKGEVSAGVDDVVYLRKTKPTEYALIKKFSNGLIQATFTDHTVVMIVLDQHRNASQFVFVQEKNQVFRVFDSFADFKRQASQATKLYLDHIQKTILNN